MTMLASVSARADIIVHDLEFRAGIGARPGIIFAPDFPKATLTA